MSDCAKRPLLVGIAGGSGAGKTTIAKILRTKLGSKKTEIIALDRFFKPLQKLPKYLSLYHGEYRPDFNRPDSLYARKMASFCKKLSGRRVFLLDGHFSLYFPQMRRLLGVKCFVDSGIKEMLARRTRRNLKINYGGSRDDIMHYNNECVEPNYRRFLLPTKKYADIIIPNGKRLAARKRAINRLIEIINARVFKSL